MFIKPVEGRRVYDPELDAVLPAAGREVEATNYWLRRLGDGDVIEIEPEPTATISPSTPETASKRRS